MGPKRVRTTEKPQETDPQEAPAPAQTAPEEAPAPGDEPMSTFEEDLESKLKEVEVPAEASHFPTHPTPNL